MGGFEIGIYGIIQKENRKTGSLENHGIFSYFPEAVRSSFGSERLHNKETTAWQQRTKIGAWTKSFTPTALFPMAARCNGLLPMLHTAFKSALCCINKLTATWAWKRMTSKRVVSVMCVWVGVRLWSRVLLATFARTNTAQQHCCRTEHKYVAKMSPYWCLNPSHLPSPCHSHSHQSPTVD